MQNFCLLSSKALGLKINSCYCILFSNLKQKKNTTLLLVELLAVTWVPCILRQPLCVCIYIYIYIYHHHHHVMLVALISLTLSRHSSLSFIASGRSSGQHPVSSHSCWMYVRAGRPAFAQPCVGVHKNTSLMSSSLLLQQCPACLICLTWIVFVIVWCLIGCCCQDIYIYIYIYILRQHPRKHQLYGHLPPIMKTIKVRWARHAGHCWRSRDELISDVLLLTPSHGWAKARRPARTYI